MILDYRKLFIKKKEPQKTLASKSFPFTILSNKEEDTQRKALHALVHTLSNRVCLFLNTNGLGGKTFHIERQEDVNPYAGDELLAMTMVLTVFYEGGPGDTEGTGGKEAGRAA
jgi:hypothetical protein